VVEQRREKAAEKKRGQRAGAGSATNRDGNEGDSSSIREGIDDEKPSNQTPLFGDSAGQNTASPGDQSQTRARPRPNPSPPSPSEKEKEGLASQDGQPPRIGDRPRIPTACRPLVDALSNARLSVGWDLKPAEWFLVEALIQRCGIQALVISARASWHGARTTPRSGNYFLPGWRALPDAPAAATPQGYALPAAVGADIVPFQQPGRSLSGTDARFAEHLDVIAQLKAMEGP
jgi:hypothetical protein